MVDFTFEFDHYFSFVQGRTRRANAAHCVKTTYARTSLFRDYFFNRIAIIWNGIPEACSCQYHCSPRFIVVSPLIALINDQITDVRSREVEAVSFTGETDSTRRQQILYKLRAGDPELKRIYTTPETLNRDVVLKEIVKTVGEKDLISYLIYDEAHCISQRGNGFRRDYLAVAEMGKILVPKAPTILLSATATQDALIYCSTKRECQEVNALLESKGISNQPYHVELSQALKESLQKKWTKGEIKVLCCTTAFGMGINKPSVRVVMFHSFPSCMEDLFQAWGRAGRDGLLPNAICIFHLETEFST